VRNTYDQLTSPILFSGAKYCMITGCEIDDLLKRQGSRYLIFFDAYQLLGMRLCNKMGLNFSRDTASRRETSNILPIDKAEAGDIPPDIPTVAARSIDFPPITDEDVRKSVIEAGNTAPGADEVPTAILKAAWPQIYVRVSTLFRQCLLYGYHLACFRTAILANIPKPNKADLSSPRSYRPIALLSTLGKGLEQLLARKIAWLTITLQVTNS
jgi:hypothetical protein